SAGRRPPSWPASSAATHRLRRESVRHGEGVAEELHQGRGRAADPRVLVDEARCYDVVLGQARRAEEVLALEVIRERVLGIGPGWDALERVAAEFEPLREGAPARGASPALRVCDDRLADACRGLGGRVPDAAAGTAPAGADVQVVAGAGGVLGPLVPKLDAEVGLVGRLVLRETCVPVDTEERAAARPRVGAEVGADLLEPRRESVDEGESRLEQLL